jgi:RpiR family carbohydrate utilization transcriptional regulator
VITNVPNLLEQLHKDKHLLSPSEQKVATVVLAQPEAVIYWTLADLARAAQVSEPTVLRFCRSNGCDGFHEFKVRLAQSVVAHFPYADLEIGPNDSAGNYATKVFQATVDTLVKVRKQLDERAIERAVAAISAARKLDFYGLGASGAVALDAYHKFFRLIPACVAYTDSHMQYMSAATLSERDVVVAISHTGRTKELLESVSLARESHATVIAITAPESPLAELSSILLSVEVPEDTDSYTPMISRIAHLVVIDTLAVGVAIQGGRGTTKRLQRMKESLNRKRVPKARSKA